MIMYGAESLQYHGMVDCDIERLSTSNQNRVHNFEKLSALKQQRLMKSASLAVGLHLGDASGDAWFRNTSF